ncbi:hypothetical protein SETIT_9G558500v2 [Setaria italica]|uniref:Uncharacterized protein n=1 Tax=Setaria italica TaxID=4555 RepID=K4AEN1_SETIT|nr:uncharacterized protein LOC101767597 [Setaria italica]RCV46776.1 hypothetical protein SETIT_9G558500v2 [Setaria italica]
MLQARTERAAAARLWVPGMSPGPMDAGSARAQEIARRREEMLGMLHDLPESEYELSLTDLVEKAGGDANEEAADTAAPAPVPPSEGKEQPDPAARSGSGRPAGKPERRASARRRDSGSVGGGSSFRSSSDGVLLNFYMPRSLTRSFTAPRPSRTPSISGGRTPSVASECNKRERDPDAETVKCWSLLWDRRWRKSSRRDPGAPPGESAIHVASAAILKAAKHSAASPGKV